MSHSTIKTALGGFVIIAALTGVAQADNDRVDMLNIGPQTESAAPAAETVTTAVQSRPQGRRSARSSEGPLTFNTEAASGVRGLIARKAAEHGIPAALADAVARVESRYNPRASHAEIGRAHV